MKFKLIKASFITLSLLTFVMPSAYANVLSGASTKTLVLPCAVCHGSDGVSKGPAIPTIAGFKQKFFIKAMKKFKNAERNSTIMTRIAKGYSDDEIKKMALYYENKSFVKAVQKFDTNLAAKGAKLHAEFCESCHKNQGQKSRKKIPTLAGQWSPYLTQELHNFLNDKRHMGRLMAKRLKKVGKENVDALVAFYASVK